MQNLAGLAELLSTPQKVVIFPHQRPDADALGSCLALSLYLKKKKHQATVISPTEYPNFLSWMPQNDDVVVYSEKTHQKVENLVSEATLICCLDFSSPNRTAPLDSFIDQNPETPILMIDHHRGKTDFAHFELWDITAAATAELVYDLILLMNDRHLIDIPTAQCLYAGIMTDTASFKHPNTTGKIHRIAADLIDMGLDSSYVQRMIYDSSTENRVRLLGHALSDCLVVRQDLKTAYFVLKQKDTRKYNTQSGDTEGIVNYALSIEGIDFAAILIDYGNEVRMSFRSVGTFSVADFARNYFGGGGHHNAAGGRSTEPLKKVVERFEELIEEHRLELTSTH